MCCTPAHAQVDALRESNERNAREDKRIADDFRAAIKAKIQPGTGPGDSGEAAPPTLPPLKSEQDQAPGASQPPLSSECNDSPQECLNNFLFGNGQESQ
ncbi:hypothetical protein DUNSADRAFT_14446 [Dunaliella salina]|uniref:Encoded protein n=1 Tax=Dunaliella salina TaxID=3046 RepID=A0ABZ3LQ32_DUNSA|nr:hypothetical protein DUNSADRAFT_14446 [Dunaliella salina]|eukprot:KAF5843530.1 hypothetical protein DUNSADRAFT_14446 [Dunaliella salina]